MIRLLPGIGLCLSLFTHALTAPQSTRTSSAAQEKTAGPDESTRTNSAVASRGIAVGDDLPKAINELDAAGITKKSAWQMGPGAPDLDITWREIEKGVTLAITYRVKTKEITSLKMMYVPPVYNRKGNIRFVGATSLQFHPDGSYSVRYIKPSLGAG